MCLYLRVTKISGSFKAADPSDSFAEMLKPVGEAGAAEVHALVEAIIFVIVIPWVVRLYVEIIHEL